MLFILLIAVIVLLFFVYNAKNQKPKNFPAGPRSFPLIGSLLSVGVDLKSTFHVPPSFYYDYMMFKQTMNKNYVPGVHIRLTEEGSYHH